MDPEEEIMAQGIAAMIEVLTCPVTVAEDHAERTRQMAVDVETFEDLAQVARGLYSGEGDSLVAELGELLAAFSATMQRHRDELLVLADRFQRLVDHERPHPHLDPEEIPVEAVAFAMFGLPDDRGAGDNIPF